ncbi:MAG: tetratricopeptide repeat protein [Chloroflexi bacterium]|nr:tetratricopeptide repeat protein [Chloroflexota bacterium]
MYKQNSIINYLLVAAVVTLAIIGARAAVFRAFSSNLFAVRGMASLLLALPEMADDLYWGVGGYDWQRSADDSIGIGPSATDGEIMLTVLKTAVLGDGSQVIMIGQRYTDACLRRLSCRILYARAAFALGREDLIRFQSLDGSLWHALAGRSVPQVRTRDELASYQHHYEALLPLFPDKPELFHILGSINRTMGGWRKALPYFEKALVLSPDNARYRCNVGEALVYSNADPERGLKDCLEAIQRSPDDLWLYGATGRSHARFSRCDEALELFEEAVRRFPNRTEPSVWLNSLRTGQIGRCPASS